MMLLWITTFPRLMTAFCTPVGRPWRKIRPIMYLSQRRSRHWSRVISPVSLDIRTRQRAALRPWAITVATAAPVTPQWSPATNHRSRITLITEDTKR